MFFREFLKTALCPSVFGLLNSRTKHSRKNAQNWPESCPCQSSGRTSDSRSRCHTIEIKPLPQKCTWSLYDLQDLDLLKTYDLEGLKIFSAMAIHMLNICLKCH